MSSEAVEEDSTASIDHPWCEQHKETIRNISGRAAYTLTEFLDSYIANPQKVGDDPLLLKSKHDFLILPSPEMLPFSTASIRNQQSLDSLVDDVVWELVQKRNKSSQTPDNVLCQGFILSEFCPNHHRSHFPMTVQHLNPAVDYCKNNFSDLHRAIGDDILRQMLLHTSLFLPLQNGNLWQITGVPIDRMDSKNKRKRGDLEATCTWTRAKRRTLVYSNGFTPKVGLGNDHILTKTTDPEQIIFSIFSDLMRTNGTKAQETGHERWVRLLRKKLLAKSDAWAGAIHVAADISTRHRLKCDYHRLLERHCPLFTPPDAHDNDNEIESSETIKQELSKLATEGFSAPSRVETFLRSVLSHVFMQQTWGCRHNEAQIFDVLIPKLIGLRRHEHFANRTLMHKIRVHSFRWLIPLASFNKADTSKGGKPRLSSKDHARLSLLVLSFLRWVFNDFLLNLLRSVFFVTDSEFSGKKLLYYRKPVWSRFRSLSLEQLLHQKRQFEQLSTQHVQEYLLNQKMGVSRLRLLPKSTGVRPIATLCKSEALLPSRMATKKPLNSQFPTQEPYTEITNEADENNETIICPEVEECIPVSSNLRPEQTDKKIPKAVSPPLRLVSTNTILNDIFAVLKFESSRNVESFGSGLDGLHYFYPRYVNFIRAFKALPDDKRQIYFASVDIRQCFDNIDQDYLMTLLRKMLADGQYVLQRYRVVHPFNSMGRLVKRQKKLVSSIEALPSFTEHLYEISSDYQSSIFSDGSSCALARRDHIIKTLHDHLTKHIVSTGGRFGDQFLRQTIGIPQGSVLSTLLCNIYYGSIEKELLYSEGVTTKQNAMLARMVDDFIFVTLDSTERTMFLKTMNEGHPSLGVQINKDKTNVLPPISECEATIHVTKFSWCGMLFDVNSGEVLIDYERFLKNESVFSFIIDRAAKPGKHLAAQMKTFVRPRCLAILFDGEINSMKTQHLNFYQMMAYAALKTLIFLKTGDMLDTVRSNEKFILGEIQSTTLYALSLIFERLKRANSGNCHLRRGNALNAGWAAFTDVFSHDNRFYFLRDAAKKNISFKLPPTFYKSMEEPICFYLNRESNDGQKQYRK